MAVSVSQIDQAFNAMLPGAGVVRIGVSELTVDFNGGANVADCPFNGPHRSDDRAQLLVRFGALDLEPRVFALDQGKLLVEPRLRLEHDAAHVLQLPALKPRV